ncbi:MAG: hypothetical protein ACPGLV_03285 [Bacteroidia bacterium]
MRKYPDNLKFKIELQHSLSAHKDCIYTCDTINTNEFYTGGGDGLLLKWDLSNTKEAYSLAKVDSSIYMIKQQNQQVIIGTNSGEIYSINTSSKKVTASTKTPKGVFTGIINDDLILLGLADGVIAWLNLNSFKLITLKKISEGHIRTLMRLSENEFAAGTSANEIILFNSDLNVFNKIDSAHSDSVFSIFKLNSNQFLSAGKDAHFKCWNLHNLKINNEVPAHLFAINSMAYNHHTKSIATASRDKSIKIWDPQTLLLQKVIDRSKIAQASTHSVNKIQWLSSNQLLSVGDDKIIRVYLIEPTE